MCVETFTSQAYNWIKHIQIKERWVSTVGQGSRSRRYLKKNSVKINFFMLWGVFLWFRHSFLPGMIMFYSLCRHQLYIIKEGRNLNGQTTCKQNIPKSGSVKGPISLRFYRWLDVSTLLYWTVTVAAQERTLTYILGSLIFSFTIK